MTVTADKSKVVIVGSGLTAPHVAHWPLEGWTVVALHHGWQACPAGRWDVFLHSHDAPDAMKPKATRAHQTIVNVLHDYLYVRQDICTRWFRRQSGFCRTIFLTGLWYALHELDPDQIGVIGCDMHYPGGDQNTFYGTGTCDPLLHDPRDMQRWLGFAAGYCHARGIDLFNLSPADSPTVLPFAHRDPQDVFRINT